MAFSTISVQLDLMVPMCMGECQRSDVYVSCTAHTHTHTYRSHTHTHADHTQLFRAGVFP